MTTHQAPELAVDERMRGIERWLLTSGPRGSRTMTASAAAIGLISLGWYLEAAIGVVASPGFLLGATLAMAGAYGLVFTSGPGFRMTSLLAAATLVSVYAGTPDLGRQIDDGAFWVVLGSIITVVILILAWAIGAAVRAFWRAVVATRR